MKYTRFETCGPNSKLINIIIDFDKDTVDITYEAKSISGNIKFSLNGKIEHRSDKTYSLVKVNSLNNNTINNNLYLDIYLFDKPMISDDCTGFTFDNSKTTIFNKFFNCTVYVNNNILSVTDKEQLDKVNLLNGVKAVSEPHIEKEGWGYSFERRSSIPQLKI